MSGGHRNRGLRSPAVTQTPTTERKWCFMTKKEMFAAINSVVANSNSAQKQELMNFIAHELELLNRRSSTKSLTPKQKENEAFKAEILSTLSAAENPLTIGELMENCSAIAELTSQRVTAIVSQLVKAQQVIRTEVKGKAYFSTEE